MRESNAWRSAQLQILILISPAYGSVWHDIITPVRREEARVWTGELVKRQPNTWKHCLSVYLVAI